MKKQDRKVLFFIIVLAIALFFIFKEDILPLATIPIESGNSPSPYPCPSGDGITCQVRGVITCDIPKGEDRIVYRTNTLSLEDYNTRPGKWISINGIISGTNFVTTSDLHVYCVTDSVVGNIGNEITPPTGKSWIYNPILRSYTGSSGVSYLIVKTKAGTNDVYRGYTNCDSDGRLSATELQEAKQLSPHSSYAGREVKSGNTVTYSCSGDFKTTDVNGNTLNTEKLSYSSDTISGTKKTAQYTINPNYKAYITGGDSSNIEYNVIQTYSDCVTDQCVSSDTFRRCINRRPSTQLDSCNPGLMCALNVTGGAICVSPINTTGKILQGFTAGQEIIFEYSVQSSSVSYINADFKLIDKRDRNSIINSQYKTLSAPSTNKISFPGQSFIGDYAIIVEKTISGTKTLDPEYSFTIGSPLTLTMTLPYSDLTANKILVGSQFYVDVKVTDNAVDVVELSTINAKATLTDSSNNVINYVVPQPVITNTVNGQVARFYFNIDKVGRFSFEATANKFNVISNTEIRSVEIRQPSIDIKFTNTVFLQNSQPGLLKVLFETKDPFGDYINTNPTVKIRPEQAGTGSADIDVTSQTKLTDTSKPGRYEFSYDFKEGIYVIEIKTNVEGYNIQTTKTSPSFDVNPSKIEIECEDSTQCKIGQICVSNKCVSEEPPGILPYIIGVGIIILIVMIIFIIKVFKKRESLMIGGEL